MEHQGRRESQEEGGIMVPKLLILSHQGLWPPAAGTELRGGGIHLLPG